MLAYFPSEPQLKITCKLTEFELPKQILHSLLALNFAFGDILAAVLISGLLSWTSWSITLSLDLTP